MPVTPTYPGVYVEEIPSGVRTITGVATSITAFIGRAVRGATNDPVIINSFGDYERTFGGLHVDYPLSYAVRDFYLNGGSQAIIVRLYKPPGTATPLPDGKANLTVDALQLAAPDPGTWGNKLRVTLEPTGSDEMRGKLGLAADDALFNLTVRHAGTGASERFLNLTVVDSPRRIDRVLAAESSLLRWKGNYPEPPAALPNMAKVKDATAKQKVLAEALKANPQDETAIDNARQALDLALAELDDAVTKAEKTLDKALKVDPPVQADIDAAKAALLAAENAMNSGINSADLDLLTYQGEQAIKTGIFALDKADLFNLLAIPADKRGGDTAATLYQSAMTYCKDRRAMLLVDPPSGWSANKDTAAAKAVQGLSELGLAGDAARNAALYFPRVKQVDPNRNGQVDVFVPCGIVAGVMARTDTARGVWKAPAGLDAGLNGVQGLEVNLNDAENGMLNPLGINCLRFFPNQGRVIWGARTLRGADQLADEYKYVPVRRTALYIEESLYRGLKWVVFEPNDEPLWAQIRLNVGAFMHNLFRQGAFQGTTPRDAYFVKCDKETTTQNDINLGIVNVVVGFAPLKPAEFVIIKLQQMAGQIEV